MISSWAFVRTTLKGRSSSGIGCLQGEAFEQKENEMSRGARLTAVQRIGMEQRHDADRVRHVCGGECMSAQLPLIIGILSASATAALAPIPFTLAGF